jgi:hypothetical protein
MALFDGSPNEEAQELIEELAHRFDPPIRVIQESTWALKAGGLVHCAVCQHLRSVRVDLPRESAGRCPEHAAWTIFYRHHSWNAAERDEAALLHLQRWLKDSDPESSKAHATGFADRLVCHLCGAETRWGKKKRAYRLCRLHNSWGTYLKIVFRRVTPYGEDVQ